VVTVLTDWLQRYEVAVRGGTRPESPRSPSRGAPAPAPASHRQINDEELTLADEDNETQSARVPSSITERPPPVSEATPRKPEEPPQTSRKPSQGTAGNLPPGRSSADSSRSRQPDASGAAKSERRSKSGQSAVSQSQPREASPPKKTIAEGESTA